jgi:hypothetical protein
MLAFARAGGRSEFYQPWDVLGTKASELADRLALPVPEPGREEIIHAMGTGLGSNVLPTGGGFLPNVLASMSGPAAADFIRQSGGGPVAQTLGGLAVGAGVGYGTQAAPLPPRPDQMDVRLLLADRARTASTSDELLQNTLKRGYTRALGRSGYDQFIKSATGHVQTINVRKTLVNQDKWISQMPEVQAAIKQTIGSVQKPDLESLVISRSILLGKGRATQVQPEKNAYKQIAEALQNDIDATILNQTGREISRRYKQKVAMPYGKVRRGLEDPDNPNAAWQAMLRLDKDENAALAAVSSQMTKDVVRRRIVRHIIEREENFVAAQAGSGAPAWRELNKKGFGSWFDRDTWNGLLRLTASNAAFRNPMRRAVTEGVATVAGAKAGGPAAAMATFIGVKGLESLVSSPSGRLALARIGRLPRKFTAKEQAEIMASTSKAINAYESGQEE